MKNPSLLRRARRQSGKTVGQICDVVGCSPMTLFRVEDGAVTPKRPLARALFRYYRGDVPLVHIYDPEFAGEVRAVA